MSYTPNTTISTLRRQLETFRFHLNVDERRAVAKELRFSVHDMTTPYDSRLTFNTIKPSAFLLLLSDKPAFYLFIYPSRSLQLEVFVDSESRFFAHTAINTTSF